MKVLLLFVAFAISAGMMAGAWWMFVPGQGRPADTYTDPPFAAFSAALALIFGVQAIAWNIVCRFPRNRIVRVFLGTGFPFAATLGALGIGNILDALMFQASGT